MNAAVAEFDDAQRRCANRITALYGGVAYRADNGDGVLEVGEYGVSAEALDAAAANGGVAWGGVARGAGDDGNLLADFGHLALDVVGLVPVVGEVADLANAAWYTAEGDYLNAGLSAAAAVPLAGWVATTGKFALKPVRSFDGAKAWVTGRPSMVPRGAQKEVFKADETFERGLRYEWQTPGKEPGTTVTNRFWAHGADPQLPRQLPDGTKVNAAEGPIYRHRDGSKFVDSAGERHPPGIHNENSPHYSEHKINDTHIPYPKDQPSPDQLWAREAVLNPAAFVDPEPTTEQ